MYLSSIIIKRIILTKIACPLVLSACSVGNTGEQHVAGEHVEFVDGFKVETTLSPIDSFRCDEIGLRSLKVVDSLLILSKSDSWHFFSTDARHDYGQCLQKGEGPNDFLRMPRCGASAFVHEKDSLIAYLCDTDRSRVYSFNVTGFIAKKDSALTQEMEHKLLSNSTWETYPINGRKLVASLPNSNFTGFTRTVIGIDSVYEPQCTKTLSNPTVKSDADINVLAKMTRVKPSGDICVEAMLFLNQINMYAIDGSWSRTLCVGSELNAVPEIEDQIGYERINAYGSASTWKFGFGAVYLGVTEKARQTGGCNATELHFFDWDGRPICRVKMPIYVLSFDIDPATQILYAIDANEDVLKAYDASAVLSAFDFRNNSNIN